MTPRDTLRGQAYFDEHVRRIRTSIENHSARAADTATSAEHRQRLRHTVFRREVELLVASYSRGDSAAALRERFPEVLRALAAYQQDAGPGAQDFRNFDAYVYALWIVSLAVLLEVPDTEFRTAVELLANDGRDALFDRLVALRMPERTPSAGLLYPEVYQPLHDALDAEGGRHTALINLFLDRYYDGMSGTYWHGSHLAEDTGYFGYWCFELAAFVKALDIDDEPFADVPFYPRDLVRPGTTRARWS